MYFLPPSPSLPPQVPVSATPGRTKHFQTLFITDHLMLCDCPGLVFPSLVSTKAEMVVSGILPIDQMRDHTPPVSLVCSLVLLLPLPPSLPPPSLSLTHTHTHTHTQRGNYVPFLSRYVSVSHVPCWNGCMDSPCPFLQKGKTLIVSLQLWSFSQHMDVGVVMGVVLSHFHLFILPSDLHGYMTSHGLPDCPRSARYILKDYVNVRDGT